LNFAAGVLARFLGCQQSAEPSAAGGRTDGHLIQYIADVLLFFKSIFAVTSLYGGIYGFFSAFQHVRHFSAISHLSR
jgi:hypothetical protein